MHRVLQVWRSIGSGPGVGRGISEILHLPFSKMKSSKISMPCRPLNNFICYFLFELRLFVIMIVSMNEMSMRSVHVRSFEVIFYTDPEHMVQ